jgi:hypothetical protein
MERRLRDPTATNKLQSIRVSDATSSTSGQDGDVDNILSFEHDDDHPICSQSGGRLELDDEADGEDLLDIEYESEWEDLFADRETAEDFVDDEDMLDFLYDKPRDDNDESIFSSSLEDDFSSGSEDMLEL